jgi:uncharacterized protein (DUF488 family)
VERAGDAINKLRLQKLLFLYGREQSNPPYDFVPYEYGPFSFTLARDISALEKHCCLAIEGHTLYKRDQQSYEAQLKSPDQSTLGQLWNHYGSWTTDALLQYTYETYPWYAQNSCILQDRLDTSHAVPGAGSTAASTVSCIYTIGYEGRSLEHYLNTLLQHRVGLLCDVRRNASSMKYGFNKRQLASTCAKLSIDYVHLPGLGIATEERRQLKQPSDYEQLFAHYTNRLRTMPKEQLEQRFEQLLHQYSRIALTCFERAACWCHRGQLSALLEQRLGGECGFEEL